MNKLASTALLAAFLLTTAEAAQNDGAAERPDPEALLAEAPAAAWETVDPENLLVMDLPSGEIIIEMRPDFAPTHVDRVRTLARRGFYDGTIFHRVIDGFMAQGGDPTGTGRGGSELPDLKGEFIKPRDALPELAPIGRDYQAPQIGFLGSLPVASQPPSMTEFIKTDTVAVWPLHCPGVMSMARAGDPNSANSQFFIMFGDNRKNLDQTYTAWGKVIDGERNVRRINRGEPPERPTPVLRARLMSDLPASEQRRVEVLRSQSETFKAWLQATGALTQDGFFTDVCSVDVPVRIGGEIS